jgi:hypothetical protein
MVSMNLRSPPMGTPRAILEILIPGLFSESNPDIKEAVVSPPVVGLVARIISSILSFSRRTRSLSILRSSGPMPSRGRERHAAHGSGPCKRLIPPGPSGPRGFQPRRWSRRRWSFWQMAQGSSSVRLKQIEQKWIFSLTSNQTSGQAFRQFTIAS